MPDSNASAEIRDLGERIVELTLVEARALRNYLRTTHGFDATLTPTDGLAGRPVVDRPPDEEDPTRFDVVLEDAGDRRVDVVKVVRRVTDLPLAEASRLVDELPQTVLGGLNEQTASHLVEQLERAGATARLE